MKKIKLTRGKYALVDDTDFAWLNQWKWCITAGYAFRKDGNKNIYMHRLINNTPKNTLTDHINRNKLDNRQANLRSVNRSLNMINTELRADNTSGFKGVSWSKEKRNWHVSICRNKVIKYIGRFKNIQDAIKARKQAELIYHKI